MNTYRSMDRLAATCLAVLLFAGCATSRSVPEVAKSEDFASWPAPAGAPVTGAEASGWIHQPLPGKRTNEYRHLREDGRDVMAVHSDSAASLMRFKVRVPPEELGRIRFSWKVPALIEEADLALRERADSPARIVLAFDGDRSRFAPRDALLSELTRTLTGEEMPYATLMYVWCNVRPPETLILGPRTDRIRKIVVQSGPQGLKQWLDYERDVRADYERAFGEAPGALIGVAILTDTDNTRTVADAAYGPVRLIPTAPHRAP